MKTPERWHVLPRPALLVSIHAQKSSKDYSRESADRQTDGIDFVPSNVDAGWKEMRIHVALGVPRQSRLCVCWVGEGAVVYDSTDGKMDAG